MSEDEFAKAARACKTMTGGDLLTLSDKKRLLHSDPIKYFKRKIRKLRNLDPIYKLSRRIRKLEKRINKHHY